MGRRYVSSAAPDAPPVGTGSDWPAREQAAKEGDDESDDVYGDPRDVKDEGILESIGKAVSSPVREAEPSEPEKQGDAKGRPK
jgi:hypothetical protein